MLRKFREVSRAAAGHRRSACLPACGLCPALNTGFLVASGKAAEVSPPASLSSPETGMVVEPEGGLRAQAGRILEESTPDQRANGYRERTLREQTPPRAGFTGAKRQTGFKRVPGMQSHTASFPIPSPPLTGLFPCSMPQFPLCVVIKPHASTTLTTGSGSPSPPAGPEGKLQRTGGRNLSCLRGPGLHPEVGGLEGSKLGKVTARLTAQVSGEAPWVVRKEQSNPSPKQRFSSPAPRSPNRGLCTRPLARAFLHWGARCKSDK